VQDGGVDLLSLAQRMHQLVQVTLARAQLFPKEVFGLLLTETRHLRELSPVLVVRMGPCKRVIIVNGREESTY
jgi:hypothetical protein